MTAEFEEAFKALKAIFVARTIDGIVLNDEPAKYYVATTFHKIQDKRYVGGKPIWLGGVEIKKNYVTLHFMPFYVQPRMLEGMSAELKKRMHGKACFNF